MRNLSILFLLFTLSTTQRVSAQYVKDVLVTDIQGRAIVSTDYSNIEGFPYLYENWNKGLVKLIDGRTVRNLDLKYDLLTDELLFKNLKNGEMLRFAESVIAFKLDSSAQNNTELQFKNGYKPANGNSSTSYYQVLFDGGTPLLKRREKSVLEKKVYNSATSTKSFEEAETYYLSKSNGLIKIRRDKKQILAVLVDHAAELEEYIKANNLNLKNEAQLIQLIGYYNSL